MSQINQYGQNTWGPVFRQDTFIPDQLIAGPLQLVTETVTIAAGAKYVRGTVLGLVDSGDKYTLSVKTASDGSQNPSAILVDNVDATAGDVCAGVYLMGEFNIHRITADVSWTPAGLRSEMRKYGLFLKDTSAAPLAPEMPSS
ncbi:head decoration protein [Salmonella enterica]|uniref:head decoration protein n=1 Tax=Salmonella enterica TaxID=28901 RepID=UPI00098F8481|nr:head decoration protein [Salmonella enterica]EAM4436541.1 head decoration protein [Salmonella enterica subsp. enterica serovar Give]EAN3269629.1 head decoration protein [Salmonella enterica subsp. enterica serovar Oranienburg]EAU5127748.1 head decoration protein [Salmonella enterica subsp. enterica serovar Infantis]ECC3903266.1 head decoration protein [Salmonella enterica subsp. enterica]ECX5681448.1 head decoration protein [Salmonella enterica subsp. enterica serovar Newport]ECY3797152.1 